MKVLGLILIQFLSYSNYKDLKPCEKKLSIVKADFKISSATPEIPDTPEYSAYHTLFTFESKVPIKPFKLVEKLPEGKNFDFSFEVNPKKVNKNTIKVSENGDFKLTIKKGSKFSVLDNDATDGSATIEIPESAINTFIGIPEKEEEQKSTSTAKLTVEDSLYYGKQEIKPLSNKEIHEIFEKNKKEDDKKFETKKYNPEEEKKEYEGWYTGEREDGTWYQMGKRPVPIPSDWKSDNGNDYVLNFKNQGIKQFDFKGYKVSNTNGYEYPDGIGKVGVKGGTVSLTGVGKIEIPEGALNNDTTIVLRQELSGYRHYRFGLHRPMFYDYASPIIKLEPFGLKLNKMANIYAETDKARLGNNNPYMVLYGDYSFDKKEWKGLGLNVPEGTKPKDWKDTFPFEINQFSYFAKFINNNTKPDSKSTIWIPYEDESFNIKATKNNYVFIRDETKGVLSKTDKIEIANRFNSAYEYYKSLTGLNPALLWNDKKKGDLNLIPINIISLDDPKVGGGTYLDDETQTKAQIDMNFSINKAKFGEEHEMWHVFQFAHEPKEDMRYYAWIVESSAMYMGAKTFKKFNESIATSKEDKTTYNARLDQGIQRLNLTSYNDSLVNQKRLDLPISWGRLLPCKVINKGQPDESLDCKSDPLYEDNYKAADFFTFLSHPNTELQEPFEKGDAFQKYVISSRDNLMKYYQDYAVHSYLRDRFFDKDYKSATTINPEVIPVDKDNNKNVNKTFDLYNNSSRYFVISISEDDFYPTLKLRVKSSNQDCGNNMKGSVLFF